MDGAVSGVGYCPSLIESSNEHIHTNYSPGPEAIPLTDSARDIESKPALAIQDKLHNYEPGSEAFPLKNTDRYVEPGDDPTN